MRLPTLLKRQQGSTDGYVLLILGGIALAAGITAGIINSPFEGQDTTVEEENTQAVTQITLLNEEPDIEANVDATISGELTPAPTGQDLIADLTVTALELTDEAGNVKTTFDPGEKIYPKVTFKNIGTLKVPEDPGYVVSQIYDNKAAPATVNEKSDQNIWLRNGRYGRGSEKTYEAIPGSETAKFFREVKYWTRNAAGTFTARAFINYDNRVPESNYNNNQLTRTYTIRATALTPRPTRTPTTAPDNPENPAPTLSTQIDSSYACTGFTGTTIPPNGNYKSTAFGCSGGVVDPGDNCQPACGNPPGLCNGLSGPECEEAIDWYAADADRYNCFSKLKVTNPLNGKAAVVIVIDRGPACSQEQQHRAPIIDLSYPAARYLGGGNYEVLNVQKVADNTPLGPITVTPTRRPSPSPTRPPAQPTSAGDYGVFNTPANNNTCNGKYNFSNPMGKNFGDPNCNFNKDKLITLLRQYDPQNADFWFNVVIPCESPGYNPNLYYRCGGAGCTPDPAGAWGLFQMGRGLNGQYDHGDVNWPQQVVNATTYGKRIVSMGYTLGDYWFCAR
jgi:hypothetical protein